MICADHFRIMPYILVKCSLTCAYTHSLWTHLGIKGMGFVIPIGVVHYKMFASSKKYTNYPFHLYPCASTLRSVYPSYFIVHIYKSCSMPHCIYSMVHVASSSGNHSQLSIFQVIVYHSHVACSFSIVCFYRKYMYYLFNLMHFVLLLSAGMKVLRIFPDFRNF